MQTPKEYLARKRHELALFQAALAEPSCKLDVKSPRDVWQAKRGLRARLRAQRELMHSELSATNWRDSDVYDYAPFKLRYRYQRFDMTVESAALYPQLASRACEIARLYTSSGMAALTATLLGLDQVIRGEIGVFALEDTFFETQHLVKSYSQRLRLKLASTADELLTSLCNGANEFSASVLLVDAITPTSPASWLDKLPPGTVDLIVFDTTCSVIDAPLQQHVLDTASRLGVPLALVRSHVKLDGLGVEYGRLGSLVLLRGELPPAHAQLFAGLQTLSADAAKTLGLLATPENLFPLQGEAYRCANQERIDFIVRNNTLAAERLSRSLTELGVRVQRFDHGLFFTLEPNYPVSFEQVEDMVRSLRCRLAAANLPAHFATSFGLDCIAVSPFAHVSRHTRVLRVAMSDHASDVVERFCQELACWGQHALVRQRQPASIGLA